MSFFLNTLILVLFIVVILTIIAAIILKQDLEECETRESPFCQVFICPSNLPAQRTGEDGKVQYSG